jgi:hypothetical protein
MSLRTLNAAVCHLRTSKSGTLGAHLIELAHGQLALINCGSTLQLHPSCTFTPPVVKNGVRDSDCALATARDPDALPSGRSVSAEVVLPCALKRFPPP